MLFVKETKKGLLLHVLVVPGSAKCGIAGIHDDALRIKITARPIEGQANLECVRFLSQVLSIKKHQVTIVGGHKSRTKTVAIEGLNREELTIKLSGVLPE